jgi:hypothetical protein
MNGREDEVSKRDLVTRLLGTRGEDAGCDAGFELLAEYVESELQGRNVRDLYPAVAAHLRNCAACADDYQGLRALLGNTRAD